MKKTTFTIEEIRREQERRERQEAFEKASTPKKDGTCIHCHLGTAGESGLCEYCLFKDD